MIRRATLEDVADVSKWVGADFTEILSNEMNVCLIEGRGGAIFVWRGPDIYEAHVFFEQRGKEVLRIAREMLWMMREGYGAKMFWAAVPVRSRRVVMFTRLMGWKSRGKAEFPHGLCEIFSSESEKCPQQ